MAKVTLFWMRRDLRLEDNAGLYHALKDKGFVLPVFIFDTEILSKLDDPADPRVHFLHRTLLELKSELRKLGSDLLLRLGSPMDIWKDLLQDFEVEAVYCNHDYEPYAIERDQKVAEFLRRSGVEFKSFKDQCLFEKNEILTDQKKPYTVYTPYKKKVLAALENPFYLKSYPNERYFSRFFKVTNPESPLTIEQMGFKESEIEIPEPHVSVSLLKSYAQKRDFPAIHQGTSRLGLHLRFGTLSVRELAREAKKHSEVWLSELIWRDFFMQILWHFPHVEKKSFRPIYDSIAWRKSAEDLQRWKDGMTGYPIVDAGMRELKATGHMHNRVRMIVASFLTKHLLIHWYEGERYFASKLLDYDLSANNGNWQWAAGSGCDAAPYFRIFNPEAQTEKFDPNLEYVKKWVPELGTSRYPAKMVDHVFARNRCLQEFTKVLKG